MIKGGIENRMLSSETFCKLSHKYIQQKIKEGKVFLMDGGGYLIDENGEYRKHLQSLHRTPINEELK